MQRNPNSTPTSSFRKFFIGGLSWATSEENVKQFFERLGFSVERAQIMRNKSSGRSRGFGFVILHCDRLDQISPSYELDGRQIEVKFAVPKEEMGAKTKKIFVGGLPVSLSETTFYNHFQKYGPIVEAQIMKDRKNSRSRGFGFVRYHNEESVDEVLRYDHTINGKLVEVKKALPKHALSMNHEDGSLSDDEGIEDEQDESLSDHHSFQSDQSRPGSPFYPSPDDPMKDPEPTLFQNLQYQDLFPSLPISPRKSSSQESLFSPHISSTSWASDSSEDSLSRSRSSPSLESPRRVHLSLSPSPRIPRSPGKAVASPQLQHQAPRILSLSAPQSSVPNRANKGTNSPTWEQESPALNSPIFPNYSIDPLCKSRTQLGDSNGTVNSIFSEQAKSGNDSPEFGGQSLFSSPVDSLFSSYPGQNNNKKGEEVVKLRSFQFQKKVVQNAFYDLWLTTFRIVSS